MNWPNIWAPWRMDYIKGLDDDAPAPACFLCDAWAKPQADADTLVVHRTATGMIIMNRYPYTNGHVMVALGEHLPDLPDMTAEQRVELMELTNLAERMIHTAMNPQGINIGINIGRCAGAGLPGHLHVHLVPRWGGDTNFMQVVGGVRVQPQAIEVVHREFVEVIKTLIEPGGEN